MNVSPLNADLPVNAYYAPASALDRLVQNNQVQQNAAAQPIIAANIPATGPTGVSGVGGTAQSAAGIPVPPASTSVSISAGRQPQTLLYRAATDQIGALLPAPAFSDTATASLAAAFQTGGFPTADDISPANAASQILTESAGFFEAYVAENPGKDTEQLISDFVALIRDGFENGFAETSLVLDGLGVLEEDIILADLALTYDLVQQGLDAFLPSGITPTDGNAALHLL